jgi:hypothetical protein
VERRRVQAVAGKPVSEYAKRILSCVSRSIRTESWKPTQQSTD